MTEVVGEIPGEEKIILAGDLNEHIGERAVGYGARNAEGEMILEYAGQQKLVICNSYFKKEREKFVFY